MTDREKYTCRFCYEKFDTPVEIFQHAKKQHSQAFWEMLDRSELKLEIND